jgi:hypothetical protein
MDDWQRRWSGRVETFEGDGEKSVCTQEERQAATGEVMLADEDSPSAHERLYNRT